MSTCNADKRRIRKSMRKRLQALSETCSIDTQSSAITCYVLHLLQSVAEITSVMYFNCSTSKEEVSDDEEAENLMQLKAAGKKIGVSVFASAPNEVQTKKILQQLSDSPEIDLYVPHVIQGAVPPEMHMVCVRSSNELSDMIVNAWGIPEPRLKYVVVNNKVTSLDTEVCASPADIDVLIVPGVAFDKEGGRCGHGMGYYDRYISKLRLSRESQGLPPPILIGVALVEQLVKNVPMNGYDNFMDMIITRNGIVHDRRTYSSSSLPFLENSTHLQTLNSSLCLHDTKQKLKHRLSKSTYLQRVWMEIQNGHEHRYGGGQEQTRSLLEGNGDFRKGISLSGVFSDKEDGSIFQSSRGTWQVQLNSISIRDIQKGWRLLPAPASGSQKVNDYAFNENFKWMSQQSPAFIVDTLGCSTPKRSRLFTECSWLSWGSGGSGILSNGTLEDIWKPAGASFPFQDAPKNIVIGGNHAVAVGVQSKSIFVWGKNDFTQLGSRNLSSTIGFKEHSFQHQEVTKPIISTTTHHSQVIQRNNNSYKRNNEENTKGADRYENSEWLPQAHYDARIKWSPSNVLKVACGWNHSVILTASGDIWGWGSNSKGQLGKPSVPLISDPCRISLHGGSGCCQCNDIVSSKVDKQSSPTISLAAGGNHTLFLLSNGVIFGCGDNRYAQLGSILACDCGNRCRDQHNLSLSKSPEPGLDENSVNTFTKGIHGPQHGKAPCESKTRCLMVSQPKQVPWLSKHLPISVACGWQFSAARTHGGLVYVWGDNRKGQCAQQQIEAVDGSSIIPKPTLVRIANRKNVCITSISLGWSHVLAMEASGRIFSWGRSDMGQLGIEKGQKPLCDVSQVYEVKMPHLTNEEERVVKIACGSESSMAMTSEGALYTWGWGEHGNLGHGITKNETVPRRLKNFGHGTGYYVRDLAAGSAAVFARVARRTYISKDREIITQHNV